MKQHIKYREAGFAALEALLVLVVVVVVGVVGYRLVKRNQSASVSTVPVTQATPKIDASKVGTTSGIDQLTTADSSDEATVDKKYESTEQADATATKTAQSNVGGAYNESSL